MRFAPPSPLRESDYDAIEQAVSETDRGRWFLAEYARRNRNADTDVLLEAIARLERNLTTRDAGAAPDLTGIRLDIVDMMEAIERTKVEIAQIQNENAEQSKFELASAELDAIVEQTEKATSEILTGAEHIQEAAWTLREQGFDDKICDDLDQHATDIYTACSFQDLTGQRIQKIVHVLSYVESRLSAMVAIWGLEESQAVKDAAGVTGDERPDAHLLNGPSDDGVSQEEIDLVMDMGMVESDELIAIDSEVDNDAPVDLVDAPEDEPDEDASETSPEAGEMPELAAEPEIGAETLAEPEISDVPDTEEESDAGELANAADEAADGSEDAPEPETAKEPETAAVLTPDVEAEAAPVSEESPERETEPEIAEAVASETPEPPEKSKVEEPTEPVWESEAVEDAVAAFEADRAADEAEAAASRATEAETAELVPDDLSGLATVTTDKSGFPTGTIRVTDPADDGLTDADFDEEDPTADLTYGERQAMFS